MDRQKNKEKDPLTKYIKKTVLDWGQLILEDFLGGVFLRIPLTARKK